MIVILKLFFSYEKVCYLAFIQSKGRGIFGVKNEYLRWHLISHRICHGFGFIVYIIRVDKRKYQSSSMCLSLSFAVMGNVGKGEIVLYFSHTIGALEIPNSPSRKDVITYTSHQQAPSTKNQSSCTRADTPGRTKRNPKSAKPR